MLLKFNTTVRRYFQNLIVQNESIAGNIPLNNNYYLCNILVIYDNLSLLLLEKRDKRTKFTIALDLVVLLNWCSPILLQYQKRGEEDQHRTSKENVVCCTQLHMKLGQKTVTYL